MSIMPSSITTDPDVVIGAPTAVRAIRPGSCPGRMRADGTATTQVPFPWPRVNFAT